MTFSKYLLPAVAFVSAASAASCSIDSTSTTTIVNPAGVTALAGCTTYSGNVALETGAANAGIVDLDGIQAITGTLSYQDDDTVQTFSANDLTTTGDLQLGNLTQLSSLSMTSLASVGNLNFTGLSILQTLTFGDPGVTKAISVLVTNTELNSLTGLDGLTQVDSISVDNNPYLSTISMDFTTIMGSLDIGANDVAGNGLSVSFQSLQSAGSATFRNATTVSIPALINVTQNLGFYGNDFQSLSCPNLTQAGGVIFVSNDMLSSISMPLLKTINSNNGTFQIANNTLLTSITGFGDLKNVNGNVDLTGNFTSVNLPDLTNVGGALNVQTSANFNCNNITSLESSQVVKGSVTCAGEQSNPGGVGSTPTGTGASTSTPTKGAAVHYEAHAPLVMGGTSLLAVLLQMLL
ncbi:MAG: hypothetical protein MMC33_005101 [Icmadophila ericetorum]|nr:hypothetical protein [Icmadophila ericetorum]